MMGSDLIMDPILTLVERSSGIIDPTLGSTEVPAGNRGSRGGSWRPKISR